MAGLKGGIGRDVFSPLSPIAAARSTCWAAGARRFRKLRDLAMPTAERLVQLVRDKVTGRHVAIRVSILNPNPGIYGISSEFYCIAPSGRSSVARFCMADTQQLSMRCHGP